ncbi:hypothetical protein vseg_001874 [Gypsophila vaccaria]
MAAISPSPDSAPSVVPSPPTTIPPQPSTLPPPTPDSSGVQPEANPPESSTPLPTNAPPPNDSGTPVVTPPPFESSPPPTPSVVQTPPPVASSPPLPSVSPPPPQTNPPISSPPPDTTAPPPSPIVVPSPPPPTTIPPPAFTPPPTASPTPPSSDSPSSSHSPPPVSPNLPGESSPPPTSKPPKRSPSPPASTPPEPTPTPPAPQSPHDSPSQPAAEPQKGSPPSVPGSAPPPSVIPGIQPPVVHSPPSSLISPPGTSTKVPSSPTLPGSNSVFPQTSNNAPSKGGISSGGAIAIGVITGALILGVIGLVALWMFKRKKRSYGTYDGHVIPASIGSSPRSDIKLLVKGDYPTSYFGGSGTITPSDHGGFGQSRSWFTYRELSDATGGFSDENLLGEGGFGCVYKGHLLDGRIVAVKQLKIGGGQGEREFKAEVEIISRIHHRHLVSLVGYCIWESKRLLVYDYVPNNTLHFHLHEHGGTVMDWSSRVKIAVGAARGIAYLHEDCHPRIIHRDIKSSNILVDNNFEAQVSDFGLAKLAMDAETHVSTRVMGTFGYMAPEYATTGKLTEKSDVYSFGVVLLELITGRRPVDESQPLGDESLVEWARPLLTRALDMGEFDGLVDPRLEKNFIESEMFRMTEAAAACVRHSSSKRPRMGQVVRALSASDSGDLSNGLKVGESQIYDSAQQSAEIRWFRRMAFGSQESNSDLFSQPSQSLGFSSHIRQNMSFSAQPVQGGNSKQHIHDHQNPSFSGQHGINANSFIGHGRDDNMSGQSNQNARRPTDQRSQNVNL